MFSWSSTATKRQPSSNQYPGRRKNNNGAITHVPVEGSIRPPPSSDFSRAQHLQSYLEDGTLQRSTRRVSSDDTTYDTVFQTTHGETLIVRVNVPLTSSFASFCPAMTLAGVRVRHAWVDDRTMRITGYDPIQSESAFRSSRILLGQAVHAVVQHLQLHPPEILEITDKGLQAIQAKQSGGTTNTKQPANGKSRTKAASTAATTASCSDDSPPSYNVAKQQNSLPPAPDVPMPSIPKTYKELEDLPREDLDKYMEDELEFLSLVHHLETYAKIQTIGSSKLMDNVNLAQANLEHESELKQLHGEVKRLQESLKEKVATFQTLEVKQNALCAPPDKATTVRALNKAKKQAFDESEEYAEEWVENGDDSVDDFVKKFVEKRKVHHQRAAKIEILQQTTTKLTI